MVAEDNEKILGLIDGYSIDNIHHIDKVGHLDHLCVNSNYRKLGIASELIKQFTIRIKQKKFYI